MDRPKCETCLYWNGNAAGGWCHRYPPAYKLSETVYLQPQTDEKDWCGEHPDFPAYIAATRSAPPSPDHTA